MDVVDTMIAKAILHLLRTDPVSEWTSIGATARSILRLARIRRSFCITSIKLVNKFIANRRVFKGLEELRLSITSPIALFMPQVAQGTILI